MKAVIITLIVILGYVSASPMRSAKEEKLTRDKRDIAAKKAAAQYWKNNKPSEVGGVWCSPGKRAEIENYEEGDLSILRCVQCEKGTYTSKKGLWKKCLPCPQGQSTAEGRNDFCADQCAAGKGWNDKKKKCVTCSAGEYSEKGGIECRKCPKFHQSKRGAEECSLVCPTGFEPTEDGTSCRSCGFGWFNPKASKNGKKQQCDSCCNKKDDCKTKWTLSSATDSKNQCFNLKTDDEVCFSFLVETLKTVSNLLEEDEETSVSTADTTEGQEDASKSKSDDDEDGSVDEDDDVDEGSEDDEDGSVADDESNLDDSEGATADEDEQGSDENQGVNSQENERRRRKRDADSEQEEEQKDSNEDESEESNAETLQDSEDDEAKSPEDDEAKDTSGNDKDKSKNGNNGNRLLKALCKSGIDLNEVKAQYDSCKVKSVKLGDEAKQLLPQLQLDAEDIVVLNDVFDSEEPMSCEAVQGKPANAGQVGNSQKAGKANGKDEGNEDENAGQTVADGQDAELTGEGQQASYESGEEGSIEEGEFDESEDDGESAETADGEEDSNDQGENEESMQDNSAQANADGQDGGEQASDENDVDESVDEGVSDGIGDDNEPAENADRDDSNDQGEDGNSRRK